MLLIILLEGWAWSMGAVSLRSSSPNHGFEDIAQLSIFHNGLNPETKIISDAITRGTMMAVDTKQATKIINALASTKYQVHHDRHVGQKK